MAGLEKRRGTCPNFNNGCSAADSKKVIEVDITDDFVCPECGSDLVEIVKKPFPKWIFGVVAVVVIGAGVAAWILFGPQKSDAPATGGKGKPAAVAGTEGAAVEQLFVADLARTLTEGEEATIEVTLEPEGAVAELVWSSDNEAVATVDEGVVKAKAAGEAVIGVATADGAFSATVTVTVKPRKSAAEPVVRNAAATFTGKLRNGYPHGTGTLTFKRSRRIDLHDDRGRTASAGEYIIGEWDNGHLIQGRWYDASNNLRETIVLGKAMNPEKDHELGKCGK